MSHRDPTRPTVRPGVTVRPATVDDAPAIASIHIAGWRAAYRSIVPDKILDAFALDERTERWRRILATRSPDDPRRTWVVEAGGVVRGFAACGPGRDESAPPPSGSGEIEAIYLDPGAIGRGLGRALFAHALADLLDRGFDPLVVWVFEANAPARRFYEAAGFGVDGARNDIDFGGTVVPEIRYRLEAAERAGPVPQEPGDPPPDDRYHPAMSDATRTPGGIPGPVRAFLDAPHFATIATVDPDGSPHQAVVWYTLVDDGLVINSAIGRRWPANLLRDPRIAISVTDRHDGYRWVGMTGTVEAIDDQPTAQADIAAMARRYHADEPEEAERLIHGRFERQRRITFRVHVDTVHDHIE